VLREERFIPELILDLGGNRAGGMHIHSVTNDMELQLIRNVIREAASATEPH